MRTMQRKIAYYITPHGFGHAVRSLVVIECLQRLAPDVEIVIVADIPAFLVEENLGKMPACRRKRLDVGLVQEDSLRFDLQATKIELRRLQAQQELLVEEELRFFREEQIAGVVSDIAFLPFVAAARHGIPSIGVGNFTWDWIYQAYAPSDLHWRPLADWIRQAYRQCGLFLQLPMHGDCSVCPKILPVPLVARHGGRSRAEVRRLLGIAENLKAYLISFTVLPLERAAQKRLEGIGPTVFLYKKPLHYHFANSICLDDLNVSYAETVGAVDGVITKPGYGIVSDCLAHGTPVIYTDRGLFPEYPILVDAMTRHLAAVYLPAEELYGGHWQAAIRKLEEQPRTDPRIATDGDEVCANAILRHLGWL
jgi:hypothetical protein